MTRKKITGFKAAIAGLGLLAAISPGLQSCSNDRPEKKDNAAELTALKQDLTRLGTTLDSLTTGLDVAPLLENSNECLPAVEYLKKAKELFAKAEYWYSEKPDTSLVEGYLTGARESYGRAKNLVEMVGEYCVWYPNFSAADSLLDVAGSVFPRKETLSNNRTYLRNAMGEARKRWTPEEGEAVVSEITDFQTALKNYKYILDSTGQIERGVPDIGAKERARQIRDNAEIAVSSVDMNKTANDVRLLLDKLNAEAEIYAINVRELCGADRPEAHEVSVVWEFPDGRRDDSKRLYVTEGSAKMLHGRIAGNTTTGKCLVGVKERAVLEPSYVKWLELAKQ